MGEEDEEFTHNHCADIGVVFSKQTNDSINERVKVDMSPNLTVNEKQSCLSESKKVLGIPMTQKVTRSATKKRKRVEIKDGHSNSKNAQKQDSFIKCTNISVSPSSWSLPISRVSQAREANFSSKRQRQIQ